MPAVPGQPKGAGPPPRLLLGERVCGSPALPVWLALHQFGLSFTEIAAAPEPQEPRARALAPEHGPVLYRAGGAIWGPLPVLEALAEGHAKIWPAEPGARAQARAVAAELASGFAVLRGLLAARPPPAEIPERLRRPLAGEIQRLRAMIGGLRAACPPARGPFLFGGFCGADAMMAALAGPLTARALADERSCAAYLQALDALPALRAWMAEAGAAAAPALPEIASHLVLPEVAEQAEEQPAPPVPEAPPPPPPPPAAPPPPASPRPRLEDVDRPPIAYLDETPAKGWRRLPIVERLAVPPPIPPLPPVPLRSGPGPGEQPGQAAPPLRPRHPVLPPPPPATAPAGRTPAVPEAPRPEQRPPPEPTPPPAPPPPAAGPSEGSAGEETSFMFRLRRPGTTQGDQNERPLNRFARVLSKARPPENEEPPPDGGPGAAGGERPGIRPSSIKPIGFSDRRRR